MTTISIAEDLPSLVGRRGPLAPRLAVRLIDRGLHVRPTTVVAVAVETPTVISLELERPEGFRHHAGQYALLRLETDEGQDFRPLSIASSPNEATLRFATRAGRSTFKHAFARLRPGETVKVSRPMGSYALDFSRPAVFIAAGIGVAPVRSMLLDAAEAGHGFPLRLIYGNRSWDEVAYRSELERLAATDHDLEVTWVVGRRIDDDLLRSVVQEFADAVFYLTGPAPMVSDTDAVLRRLGVRGRRIRASKQSLPVDRLSGGRRAAQVA